MNRKLCRSLILVLLLGAVSALARAQFSQIYTFNGNVDGETPYYADLMAQGTDGNVYGTLPAGARYYDGSWFQDVPGSFPTFFAMAGNGTTLPNTGVYNPYAGFILGMDGNYYSAAVHGGLPTAYGSTYGALFKMSGGVVNRVYSFAGGTGGSYPYAPPVQGTDGNLYGVTCDPGNSGHVYQIVTSTTPATLGWIRSLPSCSRAPLFLGSDGNLYGTYAYGSFTGTGGSIIPSGGGYGGVFGITYGGAITWYYNMNPFSTNNGGKGDGSNPWGGVIQASDGNLYGTNSAGGAYGSPTGVVYEIAPNGTGFTVIHNFQSSDGTIPEGGLVQGSDGYLYGLTSSGGVLSPLYVQAGFSPAGTMFKVSLSGANFSRLYTFSRYPSTGQGSGSYPAATPLLHTSGDFYGLTYDGGYSTNGATSGNQSGFYDDGGELFKYHTGMAPFINTVTRRYGKAGTYVGIIGKGFLHATGVTFGGAPVAWGTKAGVLALTDTYMLVGIPAFAHTGPIIVYETSATGVQTTLSTTYNFRICSLLSSCP